MQARAPDEGPSGGGPPASDDGGRLCQSASEVEELHSPRLLRAVAKKYDIESTKSLVAAYNAATDEEERGILLRWLHTYNERRNDYCLQPEYVLEYAELAKIVPRLTEDEKVLKSLVRALRSRIRQGEFLEKNAALALWSALMHVDSSAYGGAADLMDLVVELLGSLSATPGLSRENFTEYEASFLALMQALFLLHENNQRGIDRKDKQMLRRVIGEKEEALEQSCKHYPVKFHFEALRQAVERLKKASELSGLCGFGKFCCSLRNLSRGDVDPTALEEDVYRGMRYDIDDGKVVKRKWFEWFRKMMVKRLEASKDEMKLELFETSYNAAMKHRRNMKDREDLKALRFAIIHELGILARDGLSENARNAATRKLVDLTTQQSINEGWIDDDDILIALLDAIYAVYKTGQSNEESKEALMALHQSCEGSSRDAFMEWLNGNSLEDKLRAESPQGAALEHKRLLIKTGRDMGHTPSIRKDLKKRYLYDDFATVASLFEEVSPKHVKEMKHHVVVFEEIVEERRLKSRERTETVIRSGEEREGESSTRRRDQAKEYYDRKTRVATPIALDDLFKRRPLKPGDPESEVQRVLLYGNPGSGKTCITKVFAHKWALGEMAQYLNAVYVVPMRVLSSTEQNREKWTRVEEAISQICFLQRNHPSYRENLITQIEDDLDDPSTLLMLDGLDEANDRAMELLSSVWERSCKVLLLSRPYNLREVETRVDIRVECLGFDDKQLRDYIKSELSEDEALRLIRFIEDSDALWEMSHVPVTAHILCSLSEKHGTATEERRKSASMSRIYDDITNFVWKRFEDRPTAENTQKVELFGDLERIAFESLRKGLILIHESFVVEHAKSKNAAWTFKESGFLLLVPEGQEYHFPHLTFQQYFAGRYIAKTLKQKGSEEKRVVEFIQQEKYNQKHVSTLSFAINLLAQRRSKFALQEMLSLVDESPVEVLGIQHFFLKMRVLEATLEGTDESGLQDLLKDEKATKLADGARQLLKRSLDDVLIRKIVVQEFQQLSRVLEGFPQVINDTIEEAKKMVACVHSMTWKQMDKITDVLKLTKNSLEQSDDIIKIAKQRVEEPEGQWNQRERIQGLSFIAERLPQLAGEVLSTLAKGCVDGDRDVRQAAMSSIGSVAAAAPQLAGEVLSTLAKGCVDGDRDVRQAAMSSIGSVAAAAPQLAGEVLSTLAKGCVDGDRDVRQAAISSIGSVAVAAPRHAGEVLPTLAKGCVDGDLEVRRAAIWSISRVAAAAPQHAGEVLPTLAKACNDGEWLVRQEAISSIGSVAVAAPRHAGEVLPTLAKGCVDGDRDVRRAAISSIGSVAAAAPQHAGEVLPTLAKGCVDGDQDVRQAAISSIGSVAAAAPQHAGEVLPTLAKWSVDGDRNVRRVAMFSISSVVEAAHQHAGEVLSTLAKGCIDGDWDVRQAAIFSICSVAAAAPQHAGEVLPTLAKGRLDENWHVRQAAMSSICGVAVAAPRHAGEVLPTLAKGCDDGEWLVRQAAISSIGSVAAAAPQHAGEVLPTLAKGCDDGEWLVRQAAISSIGSVAAAAPQHAGEVLLTLAKGCVDGDQDVRQAAISSIGSVAAAAPRHAGEVLLTLAKGCVDGDQDVRQAAISSIGSVAAAAPQHAGEVLPMLAKWCDDKDQNVRKAAIGGFTRIIDKAPHILNDLLQFFEIGCEDKHFFVRQNAVEVVGNVIMEAPNLADGFLSFLDRGCIDTVYFVRCTSVLAVGKVVGAAPHHLDRLLPMLERSHCDEDFFVRSNALNAVGSAIGAAPQLVGELMPMLESGCMDERSDVRLSASKAVGSAIGAAPQLVVELMPMLESGCMDERNDVRSSALKATRAVVNIVGKLIPMLERGCGDEHSDVYLNALKAIRGVVETSLHFVSELLPTLEKRCGKKHFYVQRNPETTPSESRLDWVTSLSSIYALKDNLLLVFVQNSFTLGPPREDKKVPVVLHAISSHEIGTWDRETLDKCRVRLKEDFEEKFPGLLENLVKKNK